MQRTIHIILALTFLSYVYCFAVNIPNADDFGMYFDTLFSFLNKQNFFELLFRKHGEHFITTTRLIAILSYKFFGAINFIWIILLGALAPVASLYILSNFLSYNKAFFLSVASLLLLNLSYDQVLTWAAASIEHLWIMPFVLLTLLLDKSNYTYRTYLQILTALLAFFTQGNGLFLLPVISFIKFFNKQYKQSILWAILTSAGLFIHLKSQSTSLNSQLDFINSFRYILSFIGAPFSPNFDFAIASGFIILLISFVLLSYSNSKIKLEIAGLFIFLLLTIYANLIARGSFGSEYAFSQSRYVYPALFFPIGILVLLFDNATFKTNSKFAYTILLSCIIFWAFSYYQRTEFLALRKQRLEDSLIRWNIFNRKLEYPNKKHAKELLNLLSEKNIYNLPNINQLPENPTLLSIDRYEIENKKIKIEESLMNDNLAFISGFIKLNKKEACSIKSLDLILSSESDSYKIPAQKRVRPDLSFKNNAHSVGFSSFFSNLNLISEKYVILLRVCSLDSCKIYPYSEKKFIRN